MFKDMDSQALMNSEVFRNFLQETAEQEFSKEAETEENKRQIVAKFEEFQMKVNANPELKNKFKSIQKRIINDSEYRDSIDEGFVQGVLLLNLED